MDENIILKTDSYKFSHNFQYPTKTQYISSYIESRGGSDKSMFFGLQPLLKNYFGTPITTDMVNEANELVQSHGLPFYREPYDTIVDEFGGFMPLKIQAVAEGTVMETENVQVQITNTDPRFSWLVSPVESPLLRAVWYPSTVATNSWKMKQIIKRGLEQTSVEDIDSQLAFKLHDFGNRGVSSHESSELGGMAHLVNFMGTDTISAVRAARKYYNCQMAGYSIPASEHSTITSWGRENEAKAYENMIALFGLDGKMFACVSDSYNIYKACRDMWGDELKEKIISSGATLVVRPDSGDATVVPIEIIEILMEVFGYTTNSKGFKVLPPYIRIIQGDGIDISSLPIIINKMISKGLSIDNIAFGMGGGLLQMVNRDDLKYAMKASAIMIDGVWNDVYKDPVHGGKTSKKGRLALIKTPDNVYKTIWESDLGTLENQLIDVWKDGNLLKEYTFEEVRTNSVT